MAIQAVITSLSLLTFCIYVIGLFHNLTKNNNNVCDMTYMFEYPQFVRIHVPENRNYIQYRLYAYSEGRYTEKARKMKFDGIPVLFLPGNAGSYKQVRSLASVALRKAISAYNYNVHFDYFTVDYNDELSGLFGGVLMKQTEFARNCIKAILNLYGNTTKMSERRPNSVIIIGHSMGGLIAKGVLSNDTIHNINLIMTLAAPLEAPVLNLDYYMHNYYAKVDDFWKTNNISENKILISIGGGPNDLLMPSAFISSPVTDLQALTTSIPGVWLTTDHRSILWCRQLVLVLNRFLFSLIDWKTKQMTSDQPKVIQDANFYIKRKKHYYNFSSSDLLPESKYWHEDSRRQYTLQFDNGITDIHYYMIRLTNLPNYQSLVITATDIDSSDWLFGCSANGVNANGRFCLSGTSLKHAISWLSAEKNRGRRQKASLDLHSIAELNRNWTHVIIKLSPTRKPAQLNVDIHNKNSRSVSVYVPSVCNNMKYTIVRDTEAEALHYRIHFHEFSSLLQAYLLYIEPVDGCSGSKYHVTAEMDIPWAEGHNSVHHFTETNRSPMRLILLKEKIQNAEGNVSVDLFLDPKCRYKISYAGSIYESAGQFSRHYTPSLISIIATVALLITKMIMTSIADISKHKMTLSFYEALRINYMQPYYLIVVSNIVLNAVKFATFSPFSPSIVIVTGFNLIVNQPYKIFVLPLFQYLIALGAILVLATVGQLSLLLSGQIAHKVLIRMVWRGPGAKGIAGIIRRVPSIAAAILTAIIPASCGAVGLTAGVVLYFFLLTRMYEDFLEEYFYRKLLAFVRKLFRKSESRQSDVNKNNTTEIIHYNEPESESRTKVGDTEKIRKSSVNDDADKTSIPREQAKIESLIWKLQEESETIANVDIAVAQKENTFNTTTEDNFVTTKIVEIKDVSEAVPNIDALVPDVHSNTPDIDKYVPDVQKAVADIHNLVPDIQTVAMVVDSNLNDREAVGEAPQLTAPPDREDVTSGLHFHFTMFTLWCLVVAMNIPSLITWAHNFKYNMILQPDPSFIPGVIVAVSAGFLWHVDKPRRNLIHWKALNITLTSIACLIIMLGSDMLFVTNYLLSLSFALITAHQTFSDEYQLDSTSPDAGDNLNNSPPGQKCVPEDSTQFEKFVDLKEKIESNDMDS